MTPYSGRWGQDNVAGGDKQEECSGLLVQLGGDVIHSPLGKLLGRLNRAEKTPIGPQSRPSQACSWPGLALAVCLPSP